MKDDAGYLSHIDVMKVVAIFFVMFNHTGKDGFFFFSRIPPDEPYFWFFISLSAFCKFAVPLFFMMSGALYLRKESVGVKYVLLKIVKLVFIIYAAYFLRGFFKVVSATSFSYVLNDIGIVSFIIIFTHIPDYVIEGDFWFLFLYLFYLFALVPIFKIKGIAPCLLFCVVFVPFYFVSLAPYYKYAFFSEPFYLGGIMHYLWMMFNVVAYPLTGYALEKNDNSFFERHLLSMWIINILLLCASVAFTVHKGMAAGGVWTEEQSQDFFYTFPFFNAVVIYVTFKKFFRDMSGKKKAVFSFLSKSVFIVYLMHVNLKYFLFKYVFTDFSAKLEEYVAGMAFFPPLLMIAGEILSEFCLCVLIYALLSKIPVVREVTRL